MLRKVRLVVFVLVGSLIAGCSKPHPTSFTRWFDPEPAYVAHASRNAFDGYVRAASMAREADELGLRRVSFTKGQRDASLKRLKGALAELDRATSNDCEFEFRPLLPFEENPNYAGWRLLGRALVWRLQDALGEGRSVDREVRQIAKFSMDLMQGGATEADLGLNLMDEMRMALAPELGQLSAATLDGIADTLSEEAKNGDWLGPIFEHEGASMLAGVQLVQNAYIRGDYSEIQKNLGPEVREAVDYLKDMHRSSSDQQLAYFKGFAHEADRELTWARQQSLLPVVERKDLEFEDNQVRPWKRFSKHFFRTLRPLLKKQVRTLARTRLLVLECHVLAHVKTDGVAPKKLPNLLDPFTGRVFSYESDGPVFKLYSPGSDGTDNGGKTGEDYEQPDLTIERGI